MGERLDTVTHRPGQAGGGAERLYLLLLEQDSSKIIPLPHNGKMVIGRAPEVGVHIRDGAASRKHAELRVILGEVEVVNIESHNGTKVNGERIASARALVSGDTIAIGETVLVFHSAAPASRPGRPLDFTSLRRRLGEEIERASHFARPLSLLAFDWKQRPANPTSVTLAAAAAVRPVDFMGWANESQLVIVFPELPPDELPAELPDVARALGSRAGVASYPDDGLDGDALLSAARAAAGSAEAGRTNSTSAAVTRIALGDRTILLADPAMVRLFDLVKRLARSDLPVLVSGETGVGKESAAWAVHHWSQRADAKFLPINCAALPENLLESELFGYEKGAFSGATQAKSGLLELAAGGTVFLDEVGELPASAQAKLLRVLETKKLMRVGGVRELEVDIRIVAATNRDLEEEVEAGRFRRDLFFRLSGATVVLPPLRDRPRELGILLRAFLTDACARLGRDVPTFSVAALATLAKYLWPGNVRELKNAIEYAAAAAADDKIELEHLPERITRAPKREPAAAPAAKATAAPQAPASAIATPFRPLADEIDELERARLSEALVAAGGVKAKAARLIGMPLRTFVAKLKHHGIVADR